MEERAPSGFTNRVPSGPRAAPMRGQPIGRRGGSRRTPHDDLRHPSPSSQVRRCNPRAAVHLRPRQAVERGQRRCRPVPCPPTGRQAVNPQSCLCYLLKLDGAMLPRTRADANRTTDGIAVGGHNPACGRGPTGRAHARRRPAPGRRVPAGPAASAGHRFAPGYERFGPAATAAAVGGGQNALRSKRQ